MNEDLLKNNIEFVYFYLSIGLNDFYDNFLNETKLILDNLYSNENDINEYYKTETKIIRNNLLETLESKNSINHLPKLFFDFKNKNITIERRSFEPFYNYVLVGFLDENIIYFDELRKMGTIKTELYLKNLENFNYYIDRARNIIEMLIKLEYYKHSLKKETAPQQSNYDTNYLTIFKPFGFELFNYLNERFDHPKPTPRYTVIYYFLVEKKKVIKNASNYYKFVRNYEKSILYNGKTYVKFNRLAFDDWRDPKYTEHETILNNIYDSFLTDYNL